MDHGDLRRPKDHGRDVHGQDRAAREQSHPDPPKRSLLKGVPPENAYLYGELRGREGVLSSTIHHFSRLKSVDLPAARVTTSVSRAEGGLAVRLEADRFVKAAHVATPGLEGRFLDNFIDLVPGRPVQILFIPVRPTPPEALAAALRVRSLRDTY